MIDDDRKIRKFERLVEQEDPAQCFLSQTSEGGSRLAAMSPTRLQRRGWGRGLTTPQLAVISDLIILAPATAT